jgi:hypothetical protein
MSRVLIRRSPYFARLGVFAAWRETNPFESRSRKDAKAQSLAKSNQGTTRSGAIVIE